MSLEVAEAHLVTLGEQKDRHVLDLLAMIVELHLETAQSTRLIEHVRCMCQTSADMRRAQDYVCLQKKSVPEFRTLTEYKNSISKSIRKCVNPLPAKSHK